MGGDKDKQRSKPGSRKEQVKIIQAETPPTAKSPVQETHSDESSRSGKSGKLSPTQIASAVFSNMTITPSVRSSSWKTTKPKQEPSKATEELAKPTENVRPRSTMSIAERDIIEVKIDRGSQPTNWIIFDVPFDRECHSGAVRWDRSKGYTFRESMEWRHPRVAYLNSLLPPKPDPTLKKKNLTVFLRFMEPLDTVGCETWNDVKGALGTILWMSKFINICVRLFFDVDFNRKLKSKEIQDVAVDLVQAIIMELQDKEEEIIMAKKANKVAILAEPLWSDIDPVGGLGVDYLSSVARYYESSITRSRRSSVRTRDFAHEGSSQAAGRIPTQRSLLENSEDMKAWLEEEKRLASAEEHQVGMGDE